MLVLAAAVAYLYADVPKQCSCSRVISLSICSLFMQRSKQKAEVLDFRTRLETRNSIGCILSINNNYDHIRNYIIIAISFHPSISLNCRIIYIAD
jgi:hypothetical protein